MLKLYTKVMVVQEHDEGASMVEYAMLVVLIAVIAMVAIRAVGDNVGDSFDQANNFIENSGP